MAICKFCYNDLQKELERDEDEEDDAWERRKAKKEVEWVWTELEDEMPPCNHKLSSLKYWDDHREVGRKRPWLEDVAKHCIECGKTF